MEYLHTWSSYGFYLTIYGYKRYSLWMSFVQGQRNHIDQGDSAFINVLPPTHSQSPIHFFSCIRCLSHYSNTCLFFQSFVKLVMDRAGKVWVCKKPKTFLLLRINWKWGLGGAGRYTFPSFSHLWLFVNWKSLGCFEGGGKPFILARDNWLTAKLSKLIISVSPLWLVGFGWRHSPD